MRIKNIGGQDYRLPDELSEFKEKMYVHLINWKWAHGIKPPGHYEYKGELIPYDAILPEDDLLRAKMPHIYSSSVSQLLAHHDRNPFRYHPHFYHMSSSQAANINLFLPILHHPDASAILAGIKGAPADFVTLDRGKLDNGYCLEFWGGNFDSDHPREGLLRDKTEKTGTDSDLAIAYRNRQNELCLWLIEHKLVEHEFTTCGGFKSEGRKKRPRCVCECSFAEILKDKNTCYYHDKCKYTYWTITEKNPTFFVNPPGDGECPFKGGMNQLWRNQLLGLAIENEGKDFKRAHFSVVRHPENNALDATLKDYKDLIADNPKFSTFTSADVIGSVEKHVDAGLQKWITWYKQLYRL